MNALDQYLALYREHREAVDAHSPAAFNALRPAALQALERYGRFPSRGDEGYEKTGIDEMFAPDFGVNVNRVSFDVDVAATFKCGVPNLSTLLGVVVGDTFRPTATLLKNLPAGVTMMSLAEAVLKSPGRLSVLNDIAANRTAMTALNTLLLQDGVYIHVARGVLLEKPLQLVNIFNSPSAMMGVRRVLIDVEDGASARVLMCDHSQNHDVDYLNSQVMEVRVGRDSSLEICDMEESSSRTRRVCELYARQERGSRLCVSGMNLVGGLTRNSFVVEPADENCETELSGLAIGSGSQVADNATVIRHAAPRCHSRQLFKYALFDRSQGAFEGTVVVEEDARFTEAYQVNRNLLVSPDARMHTMPQLEIYCDEVKCSHGAATGQLDANALFYMRSRGIPQAEARMMLVQAFMADVIDTVRYEPLRDRLRHLVEKRLGGQTVLCGECHM